ncbi:hypothetical protein LTR62_007162 [Meristemomyces frigidus]|uniref:Very-long-chain (3R)-3-hydroxyacyl-CoA dehydratase n=1 Tax=Meristemomyces frigidus TaxID=1508187 RepID=A0AAN7TAZ0_9PEZI|nr:hypothetical protein LTR62_007162 [Meristemomyces frigidus]
MNRPSDSQQPVSRQQQEDSAVKTLPPSYRTLYLILYNAISALLWSVVLGRVLLITAIHGHRYVFAGVGEWTKWTQTLAALEVVHAGIGLVRAPLLTTLMQVASRFLLVWLIGHNFPSTVSTSPAYTTMLLAWSVTEVIRYSYFAVNLAYGGVPAFMTWLRYNTFFVLYPLGISSECWLVWASREAGISKFGEVWGWFVYAVLAVYVPGAYVLFSHMMVQRRKVLRSAREKKDI